MRRFMAGVSEELKKECWADILHENMDFGRLMVHAQQVEESRRRNRDQERRKSRPSD